jgi:hypothetical protein
MVKTGQNNGHYMKMTYVHLCANLDCNSLNTYPSEKCLDGRCREKLNTFYALYTFFGSLVSRNINQTGANALVLLRYMYAS